VEERVNPAEPGLSGLPIVVNDTPMVFWDFDHPQTQLSFLSRIDPAYFRYLARVHGSHLAGEDAQTAAMALRLAYSHAIECLFALVCAAVQAPECPAGWVLKYQYPDLKSLVGKISQGQFYENKLHLDRGRWPEVASALLPWETEEKVLDEVRQATAQLWKALARNMCDKNFDAEFMSIKHGLRAGGGPWRIALGREDSPGVPAPPERMRIWASSEFGSTFYRAVNVKPLSWIIEEPRVNWNPDVFARRLPLIADSMQNVLTFLRVTNGDSSEDLGLFFITAEHVAAALEDPKQRSSSFRWTHRSLIDTDALPSLSKDEILSNYRATASSTNDAPAG
jgi:hypothetical protein